MLELSATFASGPISPWKTLFITATLLTLVFGLDDLIGRTRMRSFASAWLSTSIRFFRVLVGRVGTSTTMWRIVVVTFCTSSVALAAIVVALRVFVHHVALGFSLYFLAVVLTVPLGYLLRRYFERADVADFIRDNSMFLEIRVLARMRAAVSQAVDDTEHPPELAPVPPSFGVTMPLPGVLSAVSLAAAITLVLSLIIRIAWLITGGTTWLVVFAPPLALDVLAKRTGAETFINVGKYLTLVVLSVYAIMQV